MAIFIVLDPESRRSEGCENCAVPQPPQRAQKRRSLGTPVRDSNLFPTLPSTPPTALNFRPSSPLANATFGSHPRSSLPQAPRNDFFSSLLSRVPHGKWAAPAGI